MTLGRNIRSDRLSVTTIAPSLIHFGHGEDGAILLAPSGDVQLHRERCIVVSTVVPGCEATLGGCHVATLDGTVAYPFQQEGHVLRIGLWIGRMTSERQWQFVPGNQHQKRFIDGEGTPYGPRHTNLVVVTFWGFQHGSGLLLSAVISFQGHSIRNSIGVASTATASPVKQDVRFHKINHQESQTYIPWYVAQSLR